MPLRSRAVRAAANDKARSALNVRKLLPDDLLEVADAVSVLEEHDGRVGGQTFLDEVDRGQDSDGSDARQHKGTDGSAGYVEVDLADVRAVLWRELSFCDALVWAGEELDAQSVRR